LATVETFTGGQIAARIAPLPGGEAVFRSGIVARDLRQIGGALDLPNLAFPSTPEMAEAVARSACEQSGATHALAVLIDLDEGADRMDLGGTICIGIADAAGTVSRQARILGGREWVRLGAVELALDCLRRHLQGLPVSEKTDFERT
jgi:nicotinamide-nucleotide amidase